MRYPSHEYSDANEHVRSGFKAVPNNYWAQTYTDIGVLLSLTLFFVSENTQHRCVSSSMPFFVAKGKI